MIDTYKMLTNKEDLITWLDDCKIKNYTLVPDAQYGFVVDVAGGVDLRSEKLGFIPVKFNIVRGYFFCGGNSLISLEGAPVSVGGDFYCNYNKISNLKGCPDIVNGRFNCDSNQIKNLAYGPTSVGELFLCRNNPSLGDYQGIFTSSQIKEKINSDTEKSLLSAYLNKPRKNISCKL